MPTSTPKPTVDILTATLANHRVWGLISTVERAAIKTRFVTTPFADAETLLAQGQLHTRLGLVLGGIVVMSDPDLGVKVRLSAGEMLGYGATPMTQLTTWQAGTDGKGLIAWLTSEDLDAVCKQHIALSYFFPSLASTAAALSESSVAEPLNLLTSPIRTLVKRAPITVQPTDSIQTTAQLMRELRVSSVLVAQGDRLLGVVTDRDLRNRVVAHGLGFDKPVFDITTLAPLTVESSSPAFEAMLLMARHNIHHVPVMDGQTIVGMVTATDLTEQHSTSAVYLAGDIYKQTTVDGLRMISGRVGQLQQRLAATGASAYSIGHIVTAITDALTTRLIQLAEQQLGMAPVDYLWMAAGSQARNEQTAKSDQDNWLLLDDLYDEAVHGEYFKTFAKMVCDGLAECGYIHCPGEMMAMTDTWRQPLRVWSEYFRKWVTQPKPKALMLTCVFFDMRAIHGNTVLLENLHHRVYEQTKGNSLFLAHMVSNALKNRPPLGLFGQITLSKDAKHRNTIDLKHSAIVPIVDLARNYALAAGVTIANTHDRLDGSAQTNEISEQSARDLRDALEFLCKLRISHQARQIAAGQKPDNFLALGELSNFERSHLKEAFNVVQKLQSVLQQRYSGGRF